MNKKQVGKKLLRFRFATDSESGLIKSSSFENAQKKLKKMLPKKIVSDGGWGWVENVDGVRFCINCSCFEIR